MNPDPPWKDLFFIMLGTAVFALFLLICARLSRAEHRPSLAWMRQYKDAYGVGCCSEMDCKEATVSLLPNDNHDGMQKVQVNGIVFAMPKASVHTSETTSGYWCYRSSEIPPGPTNTRCVFYAIGG